MLNIVAISLIISSLFTAGIFSPPPRSGDPPPPLQEAHRVIFVEYAREIPSNQPQPPPTTHKLLQDAKEKLHEASTLVPNLGQGISTPDTEPGSPDSVNPEKPAHKARDLICDAYGNCKEKMASAFQKGKEEVLRKASEVEGGAKSAKNAVESALEHGKEKISRKASDVEESAKSAMESGAKKVTSTFHNGKEKVAQKSSEVEDAVEGGNLSKLSEEVVETGEGFGRDITKWIQKNVLNLDLVGTMKVVVGWMVHLVGFAVAYGTSTWVTFVSSHVLATGLGRQQFGVVQSKVYPVYFRVVGVGIGVAWIGHWFARGKGRWEGVERMEGYNLVVALGLVLVNMMYLEPKATKVMFERMKLEKEEGRGRDVMADVSGREPAVFTTTPLATTQTTTTIAGGTIPTVTTTDQDAAVKSKVAKLSKKLKKFNTYSSVINILTLMSLTWHLVQLARRLQATC